MADTKISCEDCSHIKGPIYTEFTLNNYVPLDPNMEWHICPVLKRDWRINEANHCRRFKPSGKRVRLERRPPIEEIAFDRLMMNEELQLEQTEQNYFEEFDERTDEWDRPELGDVRDDGTPVGWDPYE